MVAEAVGFYVKLLGDQLGEELDVFVWMCGCMDVWMYVHTYICMCLYVYLSVCIYIYVHIYIYTCIIHIIYVCVYIYIYTHTHTFTYTHNSYTGNQHSKPVDRQQIYICMAERNWRLPWRARHVF